MEAGSSYSGPVVPPLNLSSSPYSGSSNPGTDRSYFPPTDRSIEAKTARLAAAKERQRTLRQHGAAVSVLLHGSQLRLTSMCRLFARWRAFEPPSLRSLPPPQPLAQTPRRAAAAAAAAPAVPMHQKKRPGAVAAAAAASSSAAAHAERELRLLAERRAETERRLLMDEMEKEYGERVGHAKRESQGHYVRFLYEKQELQRTHHKALQQCEFDRLDMLAQQEARAKVREGQLFSHAMDQLHRLKSSLTERSDANEELVRMVQQQQETEDELEELRGRVSARTQSARGTEGDGGDGGDLGDGSPTSLPPSGAVDVSDDGMSRPPLLVDAGDGGGPPTPPPTPPPTLRTGRGGGGATPASPRSSARGGSGPPTPRRLAAAAAAEAAALRERLRSADEKAAAQRAMHAREIAQCDAQSSKLRNALENLEARLEVTETALKLARDTATAAEVSKQRALTERAEATRVAAELQASLEDANARLVSLGQSARTPRGATPSVLPAAKVAEGIFAGVQCAPNGGDASERGRPSLLAGQVGGLATDTYDESDSHEDDAAAAEASYGDFAPLSPSVGGGGAMPYIRKLDMSSVHQLEAELDHDLLLSQRALDFLAEVPSLPSASNPATPRSGATPRATTPGSTDTLSSAPGSGASSFATPSVANLDALIDMHQRSAEGHGAQS